MQYVDDESARAYRRICFGKASRLVERTDLIDAQPTPTLVRLIPERTGHLQVSSVSHGRKVTKMLSL
jgi:hypothetical protein